MKRLPASNFSNALRFVRKAQGLTQEDFDDVSSRVYISALERGIKQPTLPKVDALAAHLGVHPLTLLVLAYCREPRAADAVQVCEHAVATLLSEVDQLISQKRQTDAHGDPRPGAARDARDVRRRRT